MAYGKKGGSSRFHSTDKAGADSRGTKYSNQKKKGGSVTEVTGPGQNKVKTAGK